MVFLKAFFVQKYYIFQNIFAMFLFFCKKKRTKVKRKGQIDDPFLRNLLSEKNDIKFVLDTYEDPPEEHPVRLKYSVHVY